MQRTQDKEKRTYITQRVAGETAEIPDKLVIITNVNYQNAINFMESGSAYIQATTLDKEAMNKVQFDNGQLFIEGLLVSTAKLKNYSTNQVPTEIDLPFLQICFSIIWRNCTVTLEKDNSVDEVIRVYFPALVKVLGGSLNTNRGDVERFINKIYSFQTIVGIIDGEIQPVLIYMGEETDKNIIKFASPYLTRVIQKIFGASVKRNPKGEILTNTDGTPQLGPSYSFLLSASVYKHTRCKNAIINANIILALIEKAGDHVAHIKVRTIIERNPQFKASFERQTTTNKNKMLERLFKETWKILSNYSDLSAKYKNIILPDPNDSVSIPTSSKLDMVFEFPHEGSTK